MVAACELWLCIACMLFLWVVFANGSGGCSKTHTNIYIYMHVYIYIYIWTCTCSISITLLSMHINAHPRTPVLTHIYPLLKELLQPVNCDGQFGPKNMWFDCNKNITQTYSNCCLDVIQVPTCQVTPSLAPVDPRRGKKFLPFSGWKAARHERRAQREIAILWAVDLLNVS